MGASVRKTATAAAVLLALAVASGSCAKYRFGRLGAQEVVVLQVWKDAKDGGKCKLVNQIPPEIRTARGRPLVWVIDGDCSDGDTITISREFRKNTEKHTLVGDKDFQPVPAKKGERITATVRMDLPPGSRKGHFRYRVLINGKNAEFNSEAEEGSFFISDFCPIWPCGDKFSDY
jgi:hypothetical protein